MVPIFTDEIALEKVQTNGVSQVNHFLHNSIQTKDMGIQDLIFVLMIPWIQKIKSF